MQSDYKLLDSSLRVLQQLKPWINAEYYNTHVSWLVDRLKDRLSHLDVTALSHAKKSIRDEYLFQDTVPDSLDPIITNFGIFKEILNDKCSKNPKAPHKHLKELSSALGRYVCQCEFWKE